MHSQEFLSLGHWNVAAFPRDRLGTAVIHLLLLEATGICSQCLSETHCAGGPGWQNEKYMQPKQSNTPRMG